MPSLVPLPDASLMQRIDELLRCNTAPHATEYSQCRVAVEQHRTTLRELDERIVQAAELLDNLRRSRVEVELRLDALQIVTHPIRSLPTEIMAKIFQLCIRPWNSEDAPECYQTLPIHGDYGDSLDPRKPPWTFTRVSRRWRNVSVALPSLWRLMRLELFNQRRQGVSLRCYAYRLGLCTERSQGQSLSVTLAAEWNGILGFLDTSHPLGFLDTSHPLLPLLEVSMPRWERLAVGRRVCHDFQRLTGNAFGRLVHIILDEVHDSLPSNVLDSVTAPMLRSLDTDDVDSTRRNPTLCSRITSFRVTTEVGGDLSFLDGMPSLEFLCIYPGDDIPFEGGLICLPRLSCLCIAAIWNVETSHDLSFLDTPALRDLTICGAVSFACVFPKFRLSLSMQGLVAFTFFLDSEYSLLEEWENSADVMHNLLAFLAQTPNLEELNLHHQLVRPELLAGLTITSDSPVSPSDVTIPRLRRLDLSHCISKVGIEPICALLESRCIPDRGRGLCTQLEWVRVPRWVYLNGSARWKDVRRLLKVECAVTVHDDDSLTFQA